MKINVSLLREKFTINETNPSSKDKKLYISIGSNRLPISLSLGDRPPEIYIVRTNTMHSCARMVASILNDFQKFGPMLNRSTPVKWELLWDSAVTAFERQYNPDLWCAVYHNGRCLYSYGKYHPFLDVIEKCDVMNKGAYEDSVPLAEATFKKAGKDVKIHYDSNVALVAAMDDKQGRCGMILRGPARTTTFNFYIKVPAGANIKPAQAFSAAAAFLEGVQLSYFVGFGLEKMRVGLIEPYDEDHIHIRAAQQRLIKLDAEVSAFENAYQVRYRPERPLFQEIVHETEKIAANVVIKEDDVFIE